MKLKSVKADKLPNNIKTPHSLMCWGVLGLITYKTISK